MTGGLSPSRAPHSPPALGQFPCSSVTMARDRESRTPDLDTRTALGPRGCEHLHTISTAPGEGAQSLQGKPPFNLILKIKTKNKSEDLIFSFLINAFCHCINPSERCQVLATRRNEAP